MARWPHYVVPVNVIVLDRAGVGLDLHIPTKSTKRPPPITTSQHTTHPSDFVKSLSPQKPYHQVNQNSGSSDHQDPDGRSHRTAQPPDEPKTDEPTLAPSGMPESIPNTETKATKDSLVSQQDPMTRAEMGIVSQTTDSLCGIIQVPYRLMDEQRASG
jgi:hypothetical protein